MKQFKKVLSLLLCTVVMGGVLLTSCSDSGDDSPSTVAVTGVTLDKTEASVTVGSDITLTATVEPSDATNKEVEWTSGDTSIATVDGGKVTAKKTGSTTIQVKTKDGAKTAECTVTVKAKAGTITLGDSTVITVDENGKATLADGTEITVSESDDGVATYTKADGSSYTVTTDAEGNTTAKVTSADGAETDITVEVIVTVTVTEGTVKGTYAFNDGTGDVTIIVVDGKIYAVTDDSTSPVTVAKEAVGTYTITNGEISGTYNEAAFTADTNAKGQVARISITGLAPITLTWKSGDTDFTVGSETPAQGGEGGEEEQQEGDAVSYVWNFQTTTTTEVKAVDAGGDYKGKYVLSEDYEYASTPSGMILTMGKGDAANGFVYNKIATDQTLGSSTVYYVNGSNTDSTAGATIGAIEPAGDLVSLKNVQGPFTVKAYVQGNSSSDKTDRYAYIKIAGEEVYAPNKGTNTLPALGQVLKYTYSGTDRVDVVIGCAKYMRIYDIILTTAAKQNQSPTVYATAVSIDETASVIIGGTKTLTATVTPATATDKTVTWTSSDESVAKVSDAGVITGVKAGTAKITVTANGAAESETVKAECTVTVAAETKPVTSLTVKKGEAEATTLTIKDTDEPVTLTETHEPSDTTDTITWTSSNPDVATVENGRVTPVSVGETTITVKANDNVSKTVAVTVAKTPVTSVTISGTTSVATSGEISDLAATVLPANATNKTVTWSVEIPETDGATGTTIDESTGKLTAGATAGTVNVFATADGVKSEAYVVTVKAEVSVYVLEGESGTISLGKTNVGMIGETANAGGSEYLSVASDNWSSSNTIGDYTDVFYNLSGESRNITAKVKGVAGFDLYVKNSNAGRTFTVKIGDGAAETLTHPGSVNGSDIIKFTFNTASTDELSIVIGGGSGSVYPGYIVAYSAAQTIPVETVEITGAPTAAVLLADGSVQLGATVAPARATEKTITWTSDATGVATVDSTGKVTFVGAGSAKITATAPSGVKAEVTIVVQAAVVNVTGIVVKDSSDATSGTVNAGDKITLTATVSPDDASNKAVTWTSSNENAATVADGVVTAVGAGTAIITATAADGSGVSGSYTVTVNAVTTISYFAGYDKNSTLSYGATTSDSLNLITTVTDAVYTRIASAFDSVPNMNAAKSIYGLSCGNTAYTHAANTDFEEFFNVSFKITPAKAAELTNIALYGGCNKTSDFTVKVLLGETELASQNGSSNAVNLDKSLTGTSLVAGTEYTVTVKVGSVKSGKAFAAVESKAFTLANIVLTLSE